MQELMDTLWFKIEALLHSIRIFLDFIFAPLNHLGPTAAIAVLALITVAIAKYLTKTYKTKRYRELQEEFFHWYKVRQVALKCEDPEKGKRLARNIDKAKLNQVYYDYFIEGLLNNILTTYMPVIFMLAYVNETYKASNLLKLFGRDYVFRLTTFNGGTVTIGGVFWFIVSVVLVYFCWFIAKALWANYLLPKKMQRQSYSLPGQSS